MKERRYDASSEFVTPAKLYGDLVQAALYDIDARLEALEQEGDGLVTCFHCRARVVFQDGCPICGKDLSDHVDSDLDEPGEDPGLHHPSEGVPPLPEASEGGGLDRDRPEEDATEDEVEASLVEQVAKAIIDADSMDFQTNEEHEWSPEARAAILKVADYLDRHHYDPCASNALRAEVENQDQPSTSA